MNARAIYGSSLKPKDPIFVKYLADKKEARRLENRKQMKKKKVMDNKAINKLY